MVWDWLVLRAKSMPSCWPNLLFLFVLHYFLFLCGVLGVCVEFGSLAGLIERSHCLTALHWRLFFDNNNDNNNNYYSKNILCDNFLRMCRFLGQFEHRSENNCLIKSYVSINLLWFQIVIDNCMAWKNIVLQQCKLIYNKVQWIWKELRKNIKHCFLPFSCNQKNSNRVNGNCPKSLINLQSTFCRV